MMRLQPIEKPKRLMMRIAYFMTRRQFGKVMSPMKVVLAGMVADLWFSALLRARYAPQPQRWTSGQCAVESAWNRTGE